MFQSAPLRERRPDAIQLEMCLEKAIEQVSIRAPEGAASGRWDAPAKPNAKVSIRAPEGAASGPRKLTVVDEAAAFQSAPLRERRPDKKLDWTDEDWVSIRAPEGAASGRKEKPMIGFVRFQSAPLRERRPDETNPSDDVDMEFQSAPLRERRPDKSENL